MSPRAILSQASSVCGSRWRKSRTTSLARWASPPPKCIRSGNKRMPRPSPFTQADIEARRRLTGLPKEAPSAAKGDEPADDIRPEDVLTPTEMRALKTEAEQERYNEITGRNRITDEMRHVARNWDFSAALDTLGLRHIEKRERCEDELILICVVN